MPARPIRGRIEVYDERPGGKPSVLRYTSREQRRTILHAIRRSVEQHRTPQGVVSIDGNTVTIAPLPDTAVLPSEPVLEPYADSFPTTQRHP